jgi:hypothetical protein
MLDHVLLDVISAIRRAFEDALLQRQAVEERFQVDVFLGDLAWETSYSLPGEDSPPRVRADLSLDWPTWSQSAYRSWSIGEPPADPPELLIEIALRIQRLAQPPSLDQVTSVLPESSPLIGGESLERSGVTIEQIHEADAPLPQCATEVSYEGTLALDEAVMEEPAKLEERLSTLGQWVASNLVRLADLNLEFLPADDPAASGE